MAVVFETLIVCLFTSPPPHPPTHFPLAVHHCRLDDDGMDVLADMVSLRCERFGMRLVLG